ncbi:MAG: heme o synthase [Acidimicrobiia bacterium]
MNPFRKLALGTAVVTYLLVVIGGVVRVTGSGLGCPDWPRCHGRWIPPLERAALIEYSHRTVAAVVGLLVLALVVFAWRRRRSAPGMLRWSVGALALVLFQAWLGRVVVLEELEPLVVTAHLAAALALLALLIYLAVPRDVPTVDRALAFRLWVGTAGIFGLIVLGSLVTGAGAGLAYLDWPLMDGRLVPGRLDLVGRLLHFLHRVAALAVGAYLAYLLVAVRREAPERPGLARLTGWVLGVYLVQVLMGAANVWFVLHPLARVGHLALAALVWAGAFLLALLGSRASERLVAYLALTKPRIIELLLVTTVPAMVVAAGTWPGTGLVLATLVGGTLSAAGANAINSYLDRDIDARMHRTARRPLPSRKVRPGHALAFGIALGVAGLLWLWGTVNLLAALLATSALLFYVFVYTVALKRSTARNIVIGGAAGAVPVLVGWAAVTGRLEPAAWVMFAIVFAWTPPHFWALALRYREDYRRARVPMLPVVRGVPFTTRQILRYSLLLVAVTLLMFPVADLGAIYLVTALGLGAYFVWQAWQVYRDPGQAMALFRYSTVYLALLFTAMGVDRALG